MPELDFDGQLALSPPQAEMPLFNLLLWLEVISVGSRQPQPASACFEFY